MFSVNKNKGIGHEVWVHIQKTYSYATKWFVETPDYSVKNYNFYVDKCGFKFQKENICKNGENSLVFTKKMDKSST